MKPWLQGQIHQGCEEARHGQMSNAGDVVRKGTLNGSARIRRSMRSRRMEMRLLVLLNPIRKAKGRGLWRTMRFRSYPGACC